MRLFPSIAGEEKRAGKQRSKEGGKTFNGLKKKKKKVHREERGREVGA